VELTANNATVVLLWSWQKTNPLQDDGANLNLCSGQLLDAAVSMLTIYATPLTRSCEVELTTNSATVVLLWSWQKTNPLLQDD